MLTTSLHIKNILPGTLDALKRRAQLNQRSLHDEIHAILEQTAQEVTPVSYPVEWITVQTGATNDHWSRREIYGTDAR